MVSDEPAGREHLPDAVRVLLRERIESYEELEILLALERLRGTGKTVEELNAAVHGGMTLIESALRLLEARALIERRAVPAVEGAQRAEIRYFYAPQSSELDGTVRALATAYAEQPIPIIKLMSENAIQRLRTGAARAFADAFILRKDK
ncbi:MAG: hypothetical protein ACREUT_13680 [Steroidobacteraceae bacterium]